MRALERENRRKSHERALGGSYAYENYIFEKFDPSLTGTEKVYQAFLGFDPSKHNLFCFGSQGVGKTHLLHAVGHRILDAGGTVRIFSKREFAAFIRGKKSHVNDAEEVDAISYLVSLTMLGIDDIEEDPNRDTVLSAMKQVLDGRKRMGKFGTILVGNKALEEQLDHIGAKLADRIKGEFLHLIIPPGTPSARALLKHRLKPA